MVLVETIPVQGPESSALPHDILVNLRIKVGPQGTELCRLLGVLLIQIVAPVRANSRIVETELSSVCSTYWAGLLAERRPSYPTDLKPVVLKPS